jgi:iron(III) transport system substrate-binding protein
MGVTAGADSPASAQVLMSWLLSEEGQTSACGGGFTPYREGVECPTGLTAIEEEVGEGGAILVGYPEGLAEEQAEIQERCAAAGCRPEHASTPCGPARSC